MRVDEGWRARGASDAGQSPQGQSQVDGAGAGAAEGGGRGEGRRPSPREGGVLSTSRVSGGSPRVPLPSPPPAPPPLHPLGTATTGPAPGPDHPCPRRRTRGGRGRRVEGRRRPFQRGFRTSP